MVLAWNEQALDAVREERLGTPVAARLYAMVNIAIYDAVNGIDRARLGHFDRFFGRDFALVEPAGAPRRGNREAAAAAAAHAVLVALVPERAGDFDVQLAADLGRLGAGGQVIAGQLWGERVGETVVELRENDGAAPQQVLPGGTAPGQFRRDFTSAQFAELLPFGIANSLPYESDGPPALDSLAYAGALAEVLLLGNGNLPTAAFDEIFRFWSRSRRRRRTRSPTARASSPSWAWPWGTRCFRPGATRSTSSSGGPAPRSWKRTATAIR